MNNDVKQRFNKLKKDYEETNKVMDDVKLHDIEVNFTYYIYDDIIEVNMSNNKELPNSLVVTNMNQGVEKESTTIEFSSIDELEFIIKDVKQKWNDIVKQLKLKV